MSSKQNRYPVPMEERLEVRSIDDIAIRVTNVSKCYQIYDRPQDRLKQSIVPRLQRLTGCTQRQYFRDFLALRDVSFEVKKGQTVGIIGRNGSGKSTLLQIVCGTLTPSGGTVEIKGRVAALLELGSGFNPEFTGRENVYMNASVLGLSKEEINIRFNDIVAFADIGDFLDQPVKTYSSGMVMRLAFAVIAHVDADILVIDEALAVGDVFFSQKCMRFFANFQERRGTILFVSHDTAAVTNLCERTILLSGGGVVAEGPAAEICKEYLSLIYKDREPDRSSPENIFDQNIKTVNCASERRLEFWVYEHEQKPNWISVSAFNRTSASLGIGGACIIDSGYFDEQDNRLTQVMGGQPVRFSISVLSYKTIHYPAVGFVLKDRFGQAVFAESTTWAFERHYDQGGLVFHAGDVVRVDFFHLMPLLIEGEYALTLAVAEGYGHEHVQHQLLHEGLILRSLHSRLLHGISGVNNLKIAISISRSPAMDSI